VIRRGEWINSRNLVMAREIGLYGLWRFQNKTVLSFLIEHFSNLIKQTNLDGFKIWCWRRTEKISWTDHVRNEDVLLRVKEQRNILHEIRKRKVNFMGYSLCRNCLLKHVVE
jgi:hypothetical protein